VVTIKLLLSNFKKPIVINNKRKRRMPNKKSRQEIIEDKNITPKLYRASSFPIQQRERSGNTLCLSISYKVFPSRKILQNSILFYGTLL
jgi:hypothetical protein